MREWAPVWLEKFHEMKFAIYKHCSPSPLTCFIYKMFSRRISFLTKELYGEPMHYFIILMTIVQLLSESDI